VYSDPNRERSRAYTVEKRDYEVFNRYESPAHVRRKILFA